MLTLTEQQVKDLETFLMEIPAKFANPILNFLANIKAKGEKKTAESEQKD